MTSKEEQYIEKRKIEYSDLIGEMIEAMFRSGRLKNILDYHALMGAMLGKCGSITSTIFIAEDIDDLEGYLEHNINYYKAVTRILIEGQKEKDGKVN